MGLRYAGYVVPTPIPLRVLCSACNPIRHCQNKEPGVSADELIGLIEVGRQCFKIGHPEAADTQIGPVISIAAADRLSGLINDAVSKGARLVGGGGITLSCLLRRGARA